MSNNDVLASRPHEIGIDSLVSADIRIWFLKNLQTSIPILKILGRDTMESLVQIAIETMPVELTPNIDGIQEVNKTETEVKES